MSLPCAENKKNHYFSYPFTICGLILTEVSMTYDRGHLPRTKNSTWMTDLGEEKGKFKSSKFITFFGF